MYPNRLRSTLNLVLFRSCAVVQCGYIVVFRSRKNCLFIQTVHLLTSFLHVGFNLSLSSSSRGCPVSNHAISRYHGNILIATCCASGYPEPIIRFNGKLCQKQPAILPTECTNSVFRAFLTHQVPHQEVT